MKKKGKITKNATILLIQTIICGASLFFLYRYLINSIGIEKFGIWTVVISIVGIAKLSDFGISAGIVKFVAKYIANNDYKRALNVIYMASAITTMTSLITLIIIYSAVNNFNEYLFNKNVVIEALILIPYAMLYTWLSGINGILLSAMDGLQRFDLRAYTNISSSLILLGITIILTPPFGLLGVAYAQITQALISIIITLFLLKKQFNKLSLYEVKWDLKVIKEMVRFGYYLQIGNIFMMSIDPVAKIFISKYGGMSDAGYFEIANRMVGQLRSVLNSVTQVMAPKMTEYKEISNNKIRITYIIFFKLIYLSSLPLAIFLILLTPLIGKVWIDSYNITFIQYTICLTTAGLINTLTTPAYFTNYGIGLIKANANSFMIIALLNLLLC